MYMGVHIPETEDHLCTILLLLKVSTHFYVLVGIFNLTLTNTQDRCKLQFNSYIHSFLVYKHAVFKVNCTKQLVTEKERNVHLNKNGTNVPFNKKQYFNRFNNILSHLQNWKFKEILTSNYMYCVFTCVDNKYLSQPGVITQTSFRQFS